MIFNRCILSSLFEVVVSAIMKIKNCFAVILLVIALTQANPTPKTIEKKLLTDDIKETNENKDRVKKSAATFCVHIKPESSKPTLISCKENQAVVQKDPLILHAQTAPQQVQTLNVVQSISQVPQASIVVPQPVIQPFQTLQIVQPTPQPCAQASPSINMIQSIPQSNINQLNSKPQPQPKPKPTLPPVVEVKPSIDAPKPERFEQAMEFAPQPLLQPQETLSVLSATPTYREHIIATPCNPLGLDAELGPAQFAPVVQIPSTFCGNPLHGIISPCTCQNNVAFLSEPSMETMKILPVTSYSSSFPISSLIIPQDTKMTSYITQQEKAGLQSRTSTHVHVKIPAPPGNHPIHNHQKIYQKILVQGMDTVPVVSPYSDTDFLNNIYAPNGIMINAYPQVFHGATSLQSGYRSIQNNLKSEDDVLNSSVASKANNLQQTNKVPRQIDINQTSSEKIEKIEEEKKQAFLINGQRNTRSNKKEIKTQEPQSVKT
ncbi:uncharacterized protein LOC143178578 [Calliopsis andreniformis]|uniref:uncharacterized protein LOC143178578 n=1 Tax=Calliopsis andreniformis TaxID=337506 RepID=UPI003FCD94AD